MPTNGNNDADDDSDKVTEETLRQDKYGKGDVDTSSDEGETTDDDASDDDDSDDTQDDDDGQTDDDSDSTDSDDDSTDDSDDDDDERFIKEFDNIKGDTLPEYARNLEKAYKNSTAEALRLKGELDKLQAKATHVGDDGSSGDDSGDGKKPKTPADPAQLYLKQKMDDEIVESYNEFAKDYDQVTDQVEYDKFVKAVKALSKAILDSEGRVASPRELYSKAAIQLDWKPIEKQPTKKEKIGIALKGKAGSSKGSGGPKKPGGKSKVTDKMVELNRKMYPGKSDADIRKELEPYVQ